MRKILFRGKRTDGRGWVQGSYIECNASWQNMHPHKSWIATDVRSNGGWFALPGRVPVIDKTVGQFIGMFDKRCRPIFDGDILSAHLDEIFPENETRCVVAWNESDLCWGTKQDGYDADPINVKDSEDWEVIGNIHDNPELLEVKA